MQLRTFAEIATIIGVAVAVLGYMKIEPNILDEISGDIKEDVISDLRVSELSLNESDFSGASAALSNQYRAAIAVESSYSRDQSLEKVINAALKNNNFKVAILAGKKIEGSYTKSEELSKIVDVALKNKDNAGFAVVAAELIPSSYSKDQALENIVAFYERGSTEPGKLSALDQSKEIFKFADSNSHMGMNSSKAKKFADDWLKRRSYSEFLYFKDVYTFADSNQYMAKSGEEALSFALHWIDNYSREEFNIFSGAFTFADSNSGMSMSTEDSEEFAFGKVSEYRKAANKPIQPTPKHGAVDG